MMLYRQPQHTAMPLPKPGFGVPCWEAQGDGTPCGELRANCADCPRLRPVRKRPRKRLPKPPHA